MRLIVRVLLILAALAALRLLPRALRREAQALRLIGALLELTAMAAGSSAKVMSSEQRVAALEGRTGTVEHQTALITAGAGTVSNTAGTISGVQTDDVQVSGNISETSAVYSGPTNGYNTGPNGGGSTPTSFSECAPNGHVHAHGHTHSHGHTHGTSSLATPINGTANTVTALYSTTHAAGIT